MPETTPRAAHRPTEFALWGQALAAAAAGLVAMAVVAALGLWAAGAGDLPGGGFHRVVAAVVVIAAGGTVDVSGSAGFLARADAAVDVVPLSVTLAGALATAGVFLWPLRHRAVADGAELLGRIARTAAFWLLLLFLLTRVARHTFEISVGNELVDRIGAELGASPTVGFRADVPATLGVGLLWILSVLVLTFVVSRRAPLSPRLLRFQESVRPPAAAMLFVLLSYVVIGLVAGLVTLITEDRPAETFAVLCLGLPNLAWIALGVGVGGAWTGRVDDTLGLPMPRVLGEVLHTRSGKETLDLAAVGDHDGRAWVLVAVAAVVLLVAAFGAAVRSPARLPAWRHALEMAVALALTLLVVGLLTRVSAHQGLSFIGVGDLGGLGGEVDLQPELARLVGAGAVWGLVAGFMGSLPARRVRHPGEAEPTGAGPRAGTGAGPEAGPEAGPGPRPEAGPGPEEGRGSDERGPRQ